MSRPVQARSVRTLETIFVASEALIGRAGMNGFTLDAVAAEAGISKGAVMHHFRTKDALIAGLVSRKIKSLEEGTAAETARIGDHPSPALLAMIRHSRQEYHNQAGFHRALLVAATQNSQSLEAFRRIFAVTLESVRAGSANPDRSTAMMFASLGLLLSHSLGFSTLDDGQAADVFEALEEMAGDPADKA